MDILLSVIGIPNFFLLFTESSTISFDYLCTLYSSVSNWSDLYTKLFSFSTKEIFRYSSMKKYLQNNTQFLRMTESLETSTHLHFPDFNPVLLQLGWLALMLFHLTRTPLILPWIIVLPAPWRLIKLISSLRFVLLTSLRLRVLEVLLLFKCNATIFYFTCGFYTYNLVGKVKYKDPLLRTTRKEIRK